MKKILTLAILSTLALQGCGSVEFWNPDSPWIFSTEAQRRAKLPQVGEMASEVNAKLGKALIQPYYNHCAESYFSPSNEFSGKAWYSVTSIRDAEVTYETGIVIDVRYVMKGSGNNCQPHRARDELPADGPLDGPVALNLFTPALRRTAKTWAAGADGALWSAAGSWSPSGAPAAGDTVTFNNTSVHTCSLDSLGTFNGTVTIASTYSGTITQSVAVSGISSYSQAAGTWNCNGFSFSNASNTWALSGGTFSGSSQSITTGAVTFSGGTLTATSGTWHLNGSFTKSNSPTFSANGGTISIEAASTFNPGALTLNKVTVSTAAAAVTFSSGTTIPLGASPSTTVTTSSLTIAGVVTWSGTWTHTGTLITNNGSTLTGTATPTIAGITGNLTINATTTVTNAIGSITISGGNTQSITDTGDALSGSIYTLSKSAGTLTIAASTNCRLGTNPSVNSGSSALTVSGTLTWVGTLAYGGTGTITTSNGSTLTGTSTPTITTPGSITTTATTTVTNAIGTITFNGTSNSTITDASDALSGTTYAVSKTSTGTFTIAASTNARFGASPTITMGSGAVTISGTFTWSGLATWTTTGTITTSNGSTLTGTTTPTWNIAAGLTVTSTTTVTNPIGTITATGATAAAFSDTANALSASKWIVTKTGTFTVSASTTISLGANPTSSTTGNFTFTGTGSWTGNWTHTGSISVGAAGSMTGSSTPTVSLTGSLTLTSGATWTATAPITLNASGAAQTITATNNTLGVFTLNQSGNAGVTLSGSGTTVNIGASPSTSVGTGTLSVGAGTTLQVSGTWTHTGITSINGTATVSGALTVLNQYSSLTINSGATWPAAVVLNILTNLNTTCTVTAPGITFGTSTINTGQLSGAAVTIGASTTIPLGANPSTYVASTLNISGTISGTGTWTHGGTVTFGSGGSIVFADNSTLSGFSGLTLLNGGVQFTALVTIPAGLAMTFDSRDSRGYEFYGAGQTYGAFTRIGSGTSTLLIRQSATYSSFTDTAAAVAHTIQFNAGTTTTATSFGLGGSPGKVLSLTSSSSGSPATLHRTGVGSTTFGYLRIQDSTVDASPVWQAANSTNVSGNTNWIFLGAGTAGDGGDNVYTDVHQPVYRVRRQ